jgi:hypothetical protein
MEGSAVVTTRLSSATMKAATDVTTIVATALADEARGRLFRTSVRAIGRSPVWRWLVSRH